MSAGKRQAVPLKPPSLPPPPPPKAASLLLPCWLRHM